MNDALIGKVHSDAITIRDCTTIVQTGQFRSRSLQANWRTHTRGGWSLFHCHIRIPHAYPTFR
jgi:hypothetical protein